VTVHKRGFQTGAYAVASTTKGPEKFAMARSAQVAPPHTRALQLTVTQVRQAKDPASITAIVEDLEPGLNYSWRVATDVAGRLVTSETIVVQAPVCPADEDRGASNSK